MTRTRSTQKLPMVLRACARAKPRTTAMATAMPAAAEMKFCTASPTICVKYDMRRLAAVVLPVGVGDEADRGVERRDRARPRPARPG